LKKDQNIVDVLIIGGGASGLLAAISAARIGASVLVCEKMKTPGMKILASGGERCNITNTLDQPTYMERFGRQGRFMLPALTLLSNIRIRELFESFGIETMSRDGFRVFPTSHKSKTVLDGLLKETSRLGVTILTETPVKDLRKAGSNWLVETESFTHIARKVILSTGGLTYPWLGTDGKGYQIAESLGMKVADRHPAGVPLKTVEKWPGKCRADTIGKARLTVNMKKHKKITIVGDIIFANYGIAGPAILDISRQITPLIEKYGEVPITLNLRPKMTQQIWQDVFKKWKTEGKHKNKIGTLLAEHLPPSFCGELCSLVNVDTDSNLVDLAPAKIQELIEVFTNTPLTVNGSQGYRLAFITRGGIKLKEIHSETLESKKDSGLHICGEILDLDGPCGGYNLQWAFASGFLAGHAASLSALKSLNIDSSLISSASGNEANVR
jgi:predicted Rossmann fold flavoprotein